MSPEIEKAMEHFSKIKTLPLTNYGGFTIIDSEDYEKLSKDKYFKCGNKIKTTDGIPLASIVLQRHGLVDHINLCFIDNRKRNLRKANKSQNGCNRPKQSNNTIGYKGIRIENNGKFRARVVKYKIQYFSKLCDTKEEAALEYNKLAIKHHGKFAYLNII